MKSKKELTKILESIIEGTDLFLVDLSISSDNIIEVLVDSPEGVNVRTCYSLTKEIESRLDRDTEDFQLTVSSAGIGFPFKVKKQYEKNLNKLVEVTLEDKTKIEGILKYFDDDKLVIEYEEKVTVEDKKKKEIQKFEKEIEFKDIKEVKDIIVF